MRNFFTPRSLLVSLLVGSAWFGLLAMPAWATEDDSGTSINLSQSINGTRSVRDMAQYISLVYRYAISLATIIAVIMLVYGGFRYLIGSTTGDAEQGKTIIKDSLAGLILLYAAYVILNTINPSLVNLRMPGIQSITPEQLRQAQIMEVEHQVFQPPAHLNIPCALDTDCQNGGKCMRRGYEHSRELALSFDFFNIVVQAFRGGNLSEYYTDGGAGNPLEWSIDTVAALDVATDKQIKTGGTCSTGQVGERCRCAAEGCLFTAPPLANMDLLFPNSESQYAALSTAHAAVHRTFRSTVCLLCSNQHLLPSRIRDLNQSLKEDFPTNNSWTGARSCSSGLKCILFAAQYNGWFCQNVPTRNVSDIQIQRTTIDAALASSQHGVTCRTDADCTSGTSCIRIDRTAGQSSGECSQGTVGQRCKCRGFGCSIFPGVLSRTLACNAGLSCDLFSDPGADGLNADWFCAPPSTSPAPAPAPTS